MTNQPKASGAQVTELFGKIQKMQEANSCPKEIQHMMYTQLRRDLSLKEERSWQGRQEEIEMAVMHDVHVRRPQERQQMASGWPYMPRGRWEL